MEKSIPLQTWWLPRPSKSKYKGSFPLHFEKRLMKLLGYNKHSLILHPFGGKAEFGYRIDLRKEVKPLIIADAHFLPFKSETFEISICDPPYSQKEAMEIYELDVKLKRNSWIKEVVRVTKSNGIIALYHRLLFPRPNNCTLEMIISIITRVNHEGRICALYRKNKQNMKNLNDFLN